MRTFDRSRAAGAFLLLSACSDPATQTADTNVLAQVEAEQAKTAEDAGNILCARGQGALQRSCTVEQAQDDRGLILTLRHADGGFHRLLVTRDGRGVVAADGAEPARVTIPDAGSIDVAIGDGRYRLPATIKGGA
ncbi:MULTISPECIES: hypothetical protein [unclassified Sphingomonas]|uniref:hypothetical protein n=1 Tax=unclassified Sphingomonas TaxID=196159 RepID=UPI0025E3D9D7|nr:MULTISPECIES: hypothetical protein [unclassified Sphingomonas]